MLMICRLWMLLILSFTSSNYGDLKVHGGVLLLKFGHTLSFNLQFSCYVLPYFLVRKFGLPIMHGSFVYFYSLMHSWRSLYCCCLHVSNTLHCLWPHINLTLLDVSQFFSSWSCVLPSSDSFYT